jgi:hypothetical protein
VLQQLELPAVLQCGLNDSRSAGFGKQQAWGQAARVGLCGQDAVSSIHARGAVWACVLCCFVHWECRASASHPTAATECEMQQKRSQGVQIWVAWAGEACVVVACSCSQGCIRQAGAAS